MQPVEYVGVDAFTEEPCPGRMDVFVDVVRLGACRQP